MHRHHSDDDQKPTARQLLKQAEQLALHNFHRAAAAIARQAIEVGLGEACNAANCWPLDPATGKRIKRGRHRLTRLLLANLEFSGVIGAELSRRVRRAHAIGNRACHARPISASQAYSVVEVAAEVAVTASAKSGCTSYSTCRVTVV